MAKREWYFLAQREAPEMEIPPNIHLTITPIHKNTLNNMLKDLEKYTAKLSKLPPSNVGVLWRVLA